MPEPISPIPWTLPDEKLLAQCRTEAYVGSGPGGQHRNRTKTAVRITHLPTGISAVATDSRSQRENRIHALRNLRHKLAIEIRREVDLVDFVPPDYFKQYPGLHMNQKNPLYPQTVAIVLDVVKATHWNLPRAAVLLGVSTTSLIKFLREDPPLWVNVTQNQQQLGIEPMKGH